MGMNRHEIGKLNYIRNNIGAFPRKKREDAINRHLALDKRCKECDAPIPYEKRKNKFCSSSCAATTSNRNRPPASYKKHRPDRPDVVCSWCDVVLTHSSQRKYCSKQCLAASRWNRTRNKIIKADSIDVVCNKSARTFLMETQGHKCSICGIEEWTGKPVPMVMDHINGISTDSSLSNLRLVCPNCDALLPTYKGRNRGNGRTSLKRKQTDARQAL